MIFIYLLTVVVVVILVKQKWKNRRITALAKQIKCGVRSYPLINSAYLFIGNGVDRMNGLIRFSQDALLNGGITGLWHGLKYYLFLADPVDIEAVLKKVQSKSDEMRCLRAVTGNGSIFAPVSIWRPRRKALAPTFNAKNLNKFVEVFARQSVITVEQMSNAVGKGAVPLWKYITTYTLDAVCETTLNIKLNAQQSDESKFLEAFTKCSEIVSARMLQPWLQIDAVYKFLPCYQEFIEKKKVLSDFIHKAIKSCRNRMQDVNYNSNTGMKTFMELIIESSGGVNGFTDTEVYEESIVIVLAGNDTSAVGISFVLSLLAQYPEIQQKVVKELQEVFGDSSRLLTVEDLPRLKYLEAVIKETLRLYPPVPIVSRSIEKDLELPSGITLVKGCTLVLTIWGVHRNTKYWGEDAEQFRPERFLETPIMHPAAFMPFGYGARNCLGSQYAMLSMKTNIATILRNYRILSAYDKENNGHDTKNNPYALSFEVMMKDVNEWKVILEKRSQDQTF